ncbi:hypothetical protein GQ53DRAFT_847849 [Thozetella sp. PMI_491]|nr:hypothetical protein GQ53DRAFT_847849 [Thozetella sp. PMI_491]
MSPLGNWKRSVFTTRTRAKGSTDRSKDSLLPTTQPDAIPETSEIPTSIEDAQRHIESIRATKGVGDGKEPSKDLEAALKILAAELYNKPTHFLLELVQNADDNSYDASAVPMLNIRFSPGMLRLDSNEVGFNRNNVESLCSIGQSSKKHTERGTRYIGQKGIGFKSVFRVADVVYIASGAYSFKFDKTAPLGMLVPIWAKFPQPRVPGITSVLLELSEDFEPGDLLRELKAMQSQILLFLHQLKEINIEIQEASPLWRSGAHTKPDWAAKMRRNESTMIGLVRQVVIARDSKPSHYWIAEKQVDDPLSDPRRARASRPSISVGFRFDQDGADGEVETQLVYAFLPVRDYGFRFMIQADFLLIANREDIEQCAWNNALIAQIPDAFLTAVQGCNSNDHRYSWLKFLPSDAGYTGPFANVGKQIISRITGQKLLESSSGCLMRADELIIVPKRFRDARGRPFVPTTTSLDLLSDKYPIKFEKELLLLGVKEQTGKDFLKQLQDFASSRPTVFESMPSEWHSQLASALSLVRLEDSSAMDVLKTIRLIPLRDGRWVSAEEGPVVLPINSSKTPIPFGVDILEAHPIAVNDPPRNNLLTLLGLAPADKRKIAEALVKTHAGPNFRKKGLSTQELVAHALFLHDAGWRQVVDIFWFACEDGSCQRDQDVYLDTERESSATRSFANCRPKVHFLHPDYLNRLEKPESREWLLQTFSVANAPRIVLPDEDRPGHFTIHPDFVLLMNHRQADTILQILSDNWVFYRTWLTPQSRRDERVKRYAWYSRSLYWHERSQREVISVLSNLRVACHGGGTARLGDTLLPRNGVIMNCAYTVEATCPRTLCDRVRLKPRCEVCAKISQGAGKPALGDVQSIGAGLFLKVADPDDARWDFLEVLGVAMRLALEAALARLQQLRDLNLGDSEHTLAHVSPIYRHLEKRVDPAVDRYKLFREILGIGNVSLETFGIEAQALTVGDDLGRICALLESISRDFAEQRSDSPRIFPFTKCNMLPVRRAGADSGYTHLVSALGADEWFIADRPALRETFGKKIDLLAIEPDKIGRINSLVERLELKHRLLSSRAIKEFSITDSGMFMPDFTDSLRAKARYLGLLIPKDAPERGKILEKLCTLRVYETSSITMKQFVLFHGETIFGPDEAVSAAISNRERRLLVYLREDHISGENVPLEIIEQLTTLCEISSSHHLLVAHIFAAKHSQQIQPLLESRGVAVDFSDFPDIAALRFPRAGDNQARQFYGELYVGSALGRIMGDSYDANTHWTSHLRTRAGHKPLEGNEVSSSGFSIVDRDLKLARAFSQDEDSTTIESTPKTYRIEVCTTSEGLDASFTFEGETMRKFIRRPDPAKDCLDNTIYVLTRVYDLFKNPGIRFFLDPWRLYISGSMQVEAIATSGRVFAHTKAVFSETSAAVAETSRLQSYYKYRPLAPRQIRFFELFEGSGADPLMGKVHYTSLDAIDRGSYQALSYVWGLAPNKLAAFSLDTGEGIVDITPSLHLALRRFRRPKGPLWLWVDAICINQDDDMEKTLQLPLMSEIFRNASEVIGWLGPDEDNGEQAMRILSGFCSTPGSNAEDDGKAKPDSTLPANPSKLDSNHWDSVNKLFRRPWFRRVWIVQELVWASRMTLYCGRSSMAWDAFYLALRMCERQRNAALLASVTQRLVLFPDAGPIYALGRERARLHEDGRRLPLLDLLEHFAHTCATRPVDRIFALLAIAADIGPGNRLLFANYDSPFTEVVYQFARAFVAQDRTLDLLYRAGAGKSYPFCSWIPNWTPDSGEFPRTVSSWDVGQGGFQAGGAVSQTSARVIASNNVFALQILGFKVDVITSSSKLPNYIVSHGVFPLKNAQSVKEVLEQLVPTTYPTGEKPADLVLRVPIGQARRPHRSSQLVTMIMDRDFLYDGKDALGNADEQDRSLQWDPELPEVIASMLLDVDAHRYEDLSIRKRRLYERYWETVAEFAYRFHGTAFATTQRGYIGMVPYVTMPGDEIWVFPGAKVPFVLRKGPSGYQLIGECYIHGIMFGESRAFPGISAQSIQLI